MSLPDRLEDAVQALATWLLETPVISQTVRLRIEAAHWRSMMAPRAIPEAPPKRCKPVIVIDVQPERIAHTARKVRARIDGRND